MFDLPKFFIFVPPVGLGLGLLGAGKLPEPTELMLWALILVSAIQENNIVQSNVFKMFVFIIWILKLEKMNNQ